MAIEVEGTLRDRESTYGQNTNSSSSGRVSGVLAVSVDLGGFLPLPSLRLRLRLQASGFGSLI